MGCISTKHQPTVDPISKRQAASTALSHIDKNLALRASLINAVKRKDAILFEKTMQQYDSKSATIISLPDQRNILHSIAQFNFSEGMQLAIEYILQAKIEDSFKIFNYRDNVGRTPLIECCFHNSYETLEVMLKHEHLFDATIKNSAGQTASDIATNNNSPCANLLKNSSRTTAGSITNSTHFNQQPPGSPKLNSSLKSPSPKEEGATSPNSGLRSSRLNLRSLSLLTKDQSGLKTTTKLYHLLKSLEETQTTFIDEEFPHDIYSMVDQQFVQEMTERFSILKWERPTQFLDPDINKVNMFDAIDLNEVSESSLDGCELYSALAAMTEFPQRLLKVFTTKEVNKHGAYSVTFLISGIFVEILLDDYFPCIEKSQLLYSRPKSNELWFLLLEKAFAKLYGNYSEVQHVCISEAMEMITGMPSSQHPLKEAEEEDLWKSMVEYDNRNYIVCAGSYQGETYRNRIFTVIRLFEIGSKKIVKLRNHFEDFEWKGELSDGSEKWTKQIKEDLGHYEGEKNSFYVDIKEFINTFDFLSVCHYHDNWVRNGLEVIAEPAEGTYFELEVPKDMEVFISVHQKLSRFVIDAPDYDISPVEIILAESTSGGLRPIGKHYMILTF